MNDSPTHQNGDMSRAQMIVDRLVAIAEEDDFAAHAVHVLIDDESAEYHWSDDDRRDVHSAAKGVCVLAIGIAADHGLLDVDAPVAAYLPDFPLTGCRGCHDAAPAPDDERHRPPVVGDDDDGLARPRA